MPEATATPQRVSRASFATELALVLCFFCAPLFLGLNGWDLHNDESIYSYAVDRIIETGEWLTPRSIPADGPFLEKPPLKFWIVAAGIRSGLLPHDEFGLRFFDALFGAAAFVYVFLFGRWIGGVGCGFIATLMLFTIDSLLFEHGLRSNNMEGALFLAYCGGLYHFARWAEQQGPPKAHAVAVAGFLTLGFMTKFVAVAFLPLTAALAFLWRRDAWRRLQSQWRDWIVPAVLAVAVSAPWFVYQAVVGGERVWREMFGVHVYERFTASLDTGHVQPWYYYFYWTWDELTFAKSELVAIAGMAMLAVKAWTGAWPAQLILLWFIVPYALLSLTTSKVSHYAYPFFPPIALGAGWFAVTAFRGLDRLLARGIERVDSFRGRWAAPVPFVGRAVALTAVALVLPVRTYPPQAAHLVTVKAPLQALRDCAGAAAPLAQRETRVYVPYDRLRNHSFYYYLRQIGPWRVIDTLDHADLVRRLLGPGQQTLVVIARRDYDAFVARTGRRTPGIGLSDDVILLTPGPFEICRRAALAAGGTDLNDWFRIRKRH